MTGSWYCAPAAERAKRKEQRRQRLEARHQKLIASVAPETYPAIYVEDGPDLPVELPLHRDTLVFLRVEPERLRVGLELLWSWGVKYRTSMTVVGTPARNTEWKRMTHELVLVGRRGAPPVPHTWLRPDSMQPATVDVPALIRRMLPGWPLLVIVRGAA